MGLATIAVGTLVGGSIYSSNRARREQRRATRARNRIESRQRQRQTQEQLRASQRATAEIQAGAATQGITDASAVRGGVASVQTQAAENISFINQIDSAQQEIQSTLERANRYQFIAQTAAQAASLGASAATGGAGSGRATPAPVTDLSVPQG